MQPNVHCSTIYNCHNIDANQVSTNRRISEGVAHTRTHTHAHMYNRILCSHKKYEVLPFATTWVNLEGTMLNEISQRKTNTINTI